MPTTTYEPITTTTLGTAASTITLSSISSAYTDLKYLITIPSTASGSSNITFQLNNDTTNNYSLSRLVGDGSSASSSRTSNDNNLNLSINTSATLPLMITIDFMSYTSSNYKSFLIRTSNDQNGSGVTQAIAGLYQTFSPIDTIKITCGSNMAIGTTVTLYGILKA